MKAPCCEVLGNLRIVTEPCETVSLRTWLWLTYALCRVCAWSWVIDLERRGEGRP